MLSRQLMTTHNVADLLQVTETTVRTWIHDGELRAIRLGREFRVTMKDLEFFVNANATQPAPPETDSETS